LHGHAIKIAITADCDLFRKPAQPVDSQAAPSDKAITFRNGSIQQSF